MSIRATKHCSIGLAGAWLIAACQPAQTAGQGMTATGEATSTTVDPAPTSDPDDPTTSPTTTTTTAAATTEAATDPTTATVTSTTGQGTTSSPPICGDGTIDPDLGESCDEGYATNGDHAACTLACQRAICGDGLVWAGEEQCDRGNDNNDTLYGGCTTTCSLGPRCGDETVQPPEECDYGGENGTGAIPENGVACTSSCRFLGKLAFLTSGLWVGDLDGESGAHLKCQLAAAAVGFDNANKFRAWISVGPSSPTTSFEYGTPDEDIPYVRPDGVRVALDFADLVAHGPGDGLLVTETKELLLDKLVWTGTNASGQPFNPVQDCNGWTSWSVMSKGRAGRNGVDKADEAVWKQWQLQHQWSTVTSVSCDSSRRLYCFEQ